MAREKYKKTERDKYRDRVHYRHIERRRAGTEMGRRAEIDRHMEKSKHNEHDRAHHRERHRGRRREYSEKKKRERVYVDVTGGLKI
ncbi:hypothetical protein HA466_0096990 [Hirschfeldia incana]|nr:hypothetical protein HA466_0096990 [Hirschfeldia incana]KAJ0254856.1 hypothetical protein HA466_0096990 [Hirschfeldia incana]